MIIDYYDRICLSLSELTICTEPLGKLIINIYANRTASLEARSFDRHETRGEKWLKKRWIAAEWSVLTRF
jgi:hypothetical protein